MSRGTRTLTGLGLVVGGALLGMLSVTVLPWYRDTLGGFFVFGTKPSDLRQTIAFYKSAPDIYDAVDFGVSSVYFEWLGIALLIASALAAAATVGLNPRGSRLAAVLAAVGGAAGVVLTALAVELVHVDAGRLQRQTGFASNPPGYLDFLGATSVGAWGMALGFIAVGVGGLLASGGRDALRTVLTDPEPEPDAQPPADPVPPTTGSAVEPEQQPRENW